MSVEAKEGLGSARSAYLRSARHQPVAWNEWGPAAFARAVEEDKPVLLDIGAVWCHWCHVMDRESYEDPETAALINEHFIAVKVDRDERPDIDARYQAAVAAISGQSGWPLTAFLTPDGKPYFGGTYFPPVDGHGRPGLRRVLLTMAEAFIERRGEVDESAASVMAAIEHNETFTGSAPAPGQELVRKIIASALNQFDQRFGGFGTQPKFLHCAAIDLLLDAAVRPGLDQELADQSKAAALKTLEMMSRGGIYDHLAGGFHRYSVDERWVVPHFEKMSYDNAQLLRNYVHAFQTFAEPECERIARETMRWIDECLSDREQGGFYASQDADYSLDDDGDYFTWTLLEAKAVLSPAELAVAAAYFDIGEIGDMHHKPAKNVLHIEHNLTDVARSCSVSIAEVHSLLTSARRKLHGARKLRPAPSIDKTIYVGWNGMLISAYVEAGRVLGDGEATRFAVKSLDRLLESAWRNDCMAHVVAYSDANLSGETIPGVLDDYAFAGLAGLDVWQATGKLEYFDVAVAILESLVRNFWDQGSGGFFDTEAHPPTTPLGALTARRKPVQDSPTPSGNASAATLLLRLAALTGRKDFEQKALSTLECFSGVVEHFGLYAASYGLALQRFASLPEQIIIFGDDEAADALERTAWSRFAVNRSVIRLRQAAQLPPALAHTLPHVPTQPGSFALVCTSASCQPPATTPAQLAIMLGDSATAPAAVER